MDYAQGCDISRYQTILDGQRVIKPVDFQKMKAAGVSFVFIRAMTIHGERDWAFTDNWQGAKEAGIPRGAYGFNNQEKPIWYAANFYNIVSETGDLGELPPVLDHETAKINPPLPLPDASAVRLWLNTTENLWHKRPIWYTNWNYSFKSPPSWVGDCPLWVANYTTAAKPIMPKGWKDWTFWQYGTPSIGERLGVQSKEIDVDRFNGTEAQFRQWAGLPHVMTIQEQLQDHERRLRILEGNR